MIAHSPVIKTERFSLKRLSQREAPFLAELGSDPEVVKSLICDWSTASKRLQIAESWIAGSQEYGFWGVFDQRGIFGPPGGMIGFCAADKPLPLGGIGPEIFYAFAQTTWGRGVGTEVVRRFVKYLFEEPKVDAVEALVFSGLNPASDKLLTKIGMHFIGHYPLADYIGEECDATIEYELWRIRNSNYENAKINLREAAFKIGQFVGENLVSEDVVREGILNAASANRHLHKEDPELLTGVVNKALQAGQAEQGWLHYRVANTC